MYGIILHDCFWPIYINGMSCVVIVYNNKYIQYLEAVGCMICFSTI